MLVVLSDMFIRPKWKVLIEIVENNVHSYQNMNITGIKSGQKVVLVSKNVRLGAYAP